MSRRETKEPAEGSRATVDRALEKTFGPPGPATPRVAGSAQPLWGASGTLRRAAYRMPEHRVSHWLLLLVADRVDVLESGARRQPGLLAALGGGLLLSLALGRALGGRR